MLWSEEIKDLSAGAQGHLYLLPAAKAYIGSLNEGMTAGKLGVFRIYYEIVMVCSLKLKENNHVSMI